MNDDHFASGLIFFGGAALFIAGAGACWLWFYVNSQFPFGGIAGYTRYRMARWFGQRFSLDPPHSAVMYKWGGKIYPSHDGR